jgi:hypothetical protein
LATSTSGFSVGELAEHMIGLASESISEPDLIAKGVAKRHLGSSLEPEILDTMSERVQKKSEALKDILL